MFVYKYSYFMKETIFFFVYVRHKKMYVETYTVTRSLSVRQSVHISRYQSFFFRFAPVRTQTFPFDESVAWGSFCFLLLLPFHPRIQYNKTNTLFGPEMVSHIYVLVGCRHNLRHIYIDVEGVRLSHSYFW